MKIKINYLLIVLVGVISTIIGIGSVKAAEKYSYVGDVFYYNSSNLYTSSYSGIGTYYKRLCDSSNVSKSCGTIAYCVEKSKASPSSGTGYNSIKLGSSFNGFSWKEEKAIKTGEIIKNINNLKDLNSNEKYVYTYMAINKYLKFSSNSFSNKYINDVVTKVENMKICGKDYVLPKPSIEAESSNMTFDETSKGTGYYYAKFNLKLTDKDKCGTTIKYKISLPSGTKAKMYSDAKLSNEIASGTEISGKTTYTVYLKVLESDTKPGNSYKVSVSGTSSESYEVANLWKPVNSSGSYLSSLQALVTTSPKTYSRSNSDNATVEIPEPGKMKIKVSKLDENGNSLTGANIKLSVYKDSNKTDKVDECNISDNGSSCTISFDEPDQSTTHDYYYLVNEDAAPKGYMIDKKFTVTNPTKVTLGKSGTKYFYTKDGQSKEITVSNASSIYSGSYESKSGVCVGDDGVIYVDKSESNCFIPSSDDTPSTDPSVDPSSSEPQLPEGYVKGTFKGSACLVGSEGNYKIADNLADGVTPCDVTFYKQVVSGNSFTLYIRNSKTTVSISKQNINGDEVEGAELKICAKSGDNGYDKKGNECEAASNIDEEKLEWMSEGYTKVWKGIPVGTYYLIENVAPGGYLQATTAVEFNIDKYGNVTSKNLDSESGAIVIKNKLNEVTISKQDITDKKELPGAKLYICEASKEDNGKYKMVVDDYGECSPVTLADGTVAEWKSTKEPHKIQGLRPGSYYLVEDKAPLGYLDAESIVFTMNNDGTIGDENGKPIGQNKIVMYDSKNPKTGSVIIIIVASIMVIAGGVAVYFIKKRNNK